jgi:hypothetical protein
MRDGFGMVVMAVIKSVCDVLSSSEMFSWPLEVKMASLGHQ